MDLKETINALIREHGEDAVVEALPVEMNQIGSYYVRKDAELLFVLTADDANEEAGHTLTEVELGAVKNGIENGLEWRFAMEAAIECAGVKPSNRYAKAAKAALDSEDVETQISVLRDVADDDDNKFCAAASAALNADDPCALIDVLRDIARDV